jgi:hypothetical protein
LMALSLNPSKGLVGIMIVLFRPIQTTTLPD